VKAPATGATPAETPGRLVQVSAAEGQLLIKITENIVSFSQSYPIEFLSYCPPDRWQKALTQVGTWTHEIERQIKSGSATVNVPADAVFQLLDLERCISAAKESRLSAAKWAFTLSAIGTIGNLVFGLTWLTIPAYLGGLALLFGGPLMAKVNPQPQEPYKPALSGRHHHRHCMGGSCEMIAMKLLEEEKTDPNRRKVLERVVVSPDALIQKHHWGTVRPRPGYSESAVCLSKGRFRVRIEGWAQDIVVPTGDWEFCDPDDCNGNIILAVWTPDRKPGETGWGDVSQDSGHEHTYWVEYVGPLTGGKIRRAGPFGCTGDPVDHAMEDGGFKKAGVDGGYAIFDEQGNVVDEGA
jgi:hypothetical protein